MDDRAPLGEVPARHFRRKPRPVCELYDKPLRWFLTLEEGDLDEDGPSDESTAKLSRSGSAAASSVSRKIADAPASNRPMIEKVVEDLLDGMKQSDFGR